MYEGLAGAYRAILTGAQGYKLQYMLLLKVRYTFSMN